MHKCVSEEISDCLLQGPSAKSNEFSNLMSKIENRFESENFGTSREHFRVTSSEVKLDPNLTRTTEKISSLRDITSSTNSIKERNISRKTTEMLIKKKAQGMTSVLPEDRFYVVFRFLSTSMTIYYFFKRSITVGEALEILANTYPREAFGSTLRPDRLASPLPLKVVY